MRKGKNVKRKKKKEKRWEDINTSKVMKVGSLNLDLDLLWKDLGVKLGQIIEDYKTLLFSKFQKKRICFVKVMRFLKILCQIWFFGNISFVWAFLDLQLWDLIDHKGFYMWEKFQVIWIGIEGDPIISSFSLNFEVSFFWEW
jgi:hypothetical protein